MSSEGFGGLEDFLVKFKVGPGSAPSHTRFGDVCASYYIPDAHSDEFHALYAGLLHKRRLAKTNRTICMVERHAEHGPVVIDLDFRFKVTLEDNPPARRYDAGWVDRFLRLYLRELAAWVDLPESFSVYVMERPEPRLDKDRVKDGLHFVIPGVVTHPRVQILARQSVLPKSQSLFADLGIVNTHENAFDEAVISRNGWMMYGAGKPGGTAYEVTRVLAASVNRDGGVALAPVPGAAEPPATHEDVLRTVRTLSVRNKPEPTAPVRADRLADVARQEALEGRVRGQIEATPYYLDARQNDEQVHSEHRNMAAKLVAILDDDRADDYNAWLRAGWCLHNIDTRLLHEWIEFSKRSPKFQQGVCETYWSHMVSRPEGLGIGSLKMWAREDSPELYEMLMRETLTGKIRMAMSCTHNDIANVVASMFSTRFVCTSVRNNQWYEFKRHRWVPCDSGFALRRFLSVDVYNRFYDEASVCSTHARRLSASNSEDPEHQRMMDLHDKLIDVGKRLKNTPFKDSIMKECRELMYSADFESTLDSKPHLLGFENGVYDLDLHEFREGCPEDMVSYSTRISYTPYDAANPVFSAISGFFEQIQADPEVREYLLRFMGSCLHGEILEERFHFFTGSGSNGKSICIELFEKALGDYACKVPVTLLTQKRAASNAATSEVARCKGRRFVCLQEPGNDEVLNIGLMKELTGGDRIMARPLYKEPIEFKPMMRLAMTANNLPEVRSDDNGTWRRLLVVEFLSKFLERPDPAQPLEFQLDLCLSQKLSAWAPYFMSLLIEYYKVYKREGNPEPASVLAVTSRYRQNNDVVQMFVDYELEITPDGGYSVSADALHRKFKEFIKNHTLFSNMKRNEIIKSVQYHTKVRVIGSGASCKLLGLSIRNHCDFAEDAEG